MLLPGFISKILVAFRGGLAPSLIFLAVLLGFWFGMIPGFSGIHIILLVLILLLNIPVGMILFWVALGRGLTFAAAPVFYHTGLLVHTKLASVIRFLDSLPVIGLTDFDTYSVAGGMLLGPAVGIVAGLLMVSSVVKFRRMMLKLDQNSEAFRKWYSNRWVRILDRILIGKRTKDVKSLFSAKTKYIRKAGVALVVLVIAVSAASMVLLKDSKVKDYTAGALTRANGAEVNLDALGISLAGGSVSASGIQVTDPQNPANNQLAIGEITADAGMYDLLLGKVVMDQVKISDVQFNQPRSSPGKLVEEKVEQEEPVVAESNQVNLGGSLAKLDTYFKDAKALKEKLQKIRQYLPSDKEQQQQQAEEARQVPQEYLDYLSARAITAATAKIIAKQAVLEKVQIPSAIFGSSKIELTNISDAPKAYAMPITLAMDSLETGAKTNLTMDYSSDVPKLSGSFADIDMSKLQSGLSSEGLVFESGTASGSFSGTVTKETIDLAVDVSISNMKASAQGKGILGMDSQTASEALSVLENLTTTVRIVGSATDPRIEFDVDGLTEQFEQALINAGKERLNQEIEKQIEENVPDEIREAIPDDLLQGIGNMF